MRPHKIVIFVLIVVAALVAGSAYNNSMDRKAQEEEQRAAQLAQTAAQAVMSKFVKTDLTAGTGEEAKAGESVTVNYEGALDDGTVFDSSYRRGRPFTFALGAGQVIKGWDLGVVGMKVGGKRKLVIPPELAYGAQAVGPIPANSTLTFVVELLDVKK